VLTSNVVWARPGAGPLLMCSGRCQKVCTFINVHITSEALTDFLEEGPIIPRIARVSKLKCKLFCPDVWPNAGPGRRPLDSGCLVAEFAGVFVSVASAAVSFVSDVMFWDLATKRKEIAPSKTGNM